VNIFLTSIPHTGSHSLQHLLNLQNFIHIHDENINEHLMKADLIVAPLRNPRNVWLSWVRRFNKSPNEYVKRGALFLHCWERMNHYSTCYQIHFLPMDTYDREDHLIRMGNLVGMKLKTDWPLVNGSQAPIPETIPFIDFREIYSYEFVRSFYGNDPYH